jgi:HlyD family secretion protein
MKRFLLLLIVLAAAAGGGYYLYTHNAAPARSPFRTTHVKRGDLVVSISSTGTLEPEEVVDVGAQVAGMILRLGTDPKDSKKTIDWTSEVEPGTVLAQIDESLYKAAADKSEANLKQAEATLAQMQAKLYQADRDWQRAQTLRRTRGSTAISDLDYDTAQLNFETGKSSLAVAEASIGVAKAQLNQDTINLRYCTITSPVKGVIVDRRVNVGQTVVSSLTAPSLFLIAKDLKRIQIWASVNEADVGQIRIGQKATFTVDAFPDQVFKAEVYQTRLNASMTQNVVTYTVVLNTDNSSLKLLPYLTANVQFEVGRRRNVLTVPNAALRWVPKDKQVSPDHRSHFITESRTKKNAAEAKGATGSEQRSTHGVVWVEDEGFVRPIKVRIGMSDGTNTEVVPENPEELNEETLVVTGLAPQNGGGGGGSPFAPQIFGSKKQQ